MTSGYSPIGAMIASDRILEPFRYDDKMFAHGVTFGGHPVSAAVALANLDIIEREDILGNVRRNEGAFRATLEKLYDLPIVGDVRGDGYFYGLELVKDKATKETFDDDESERLLPGSCQGAVRGRQPPGRRPRRPGCAAVAAICDQSHFDEMGRSCARSSARRGAGSGRRMEYAGSMSEPGCAGCRRRRR
jgi:hypothetical protein